MRSTAIVLTLMLGTAVAGPTASAQERCAVEELFQLYARGEFAAVEQGIQREHFARGGRPLIEEVDRLIARWRRARRRTVAAFLVEIAGTGLIRLSEPSALDILTRARQVIMSRPDPPGRDPDEDAFEILFHQTAVALMFGRLPAEGLGREAPRPLRQRVVAEPQVRGGAVLVASWIALAEALVEERRAYEDAASLRRLATNALDRFDRAARYPENRAESMVRKALLLIRLGRHAEALDALETIGDPAVIDSRTIWYWALLFRGRALDALDRKDDAEAAFREALTVVPTAQTPMAALAALEMGRGRQTSAADWATRGLAASPEDTPWLHYGAGEYRHFVPRRDALRELSR